MEGLRELDSLTVYNLIDNETDVLSGPCPYALKHSSGFCYISEASRHMNRDTQINFDSLCCAGHGLSLLLEARVAGETHFCLFDAGPTPDLFRDNVQKFDVDLSRVEAVVLSHWHIDHSGGLRSALPMISRARKESRLPGPMVDIHPGFAELRGVEVPDYSNGLRRIILAPKNPSPSELEELGGSICKIEKEHTILDGCIYVSGEIPRQTCYESGMDGHVSYSQCNWHADPFLGDERYLAVKVKGRGLVVFSSCSHAGIVNICRDCLSKNSAGMPLFGVFGGFHLAGGLQMDNRIARTVQDLLTLKPTILLPGHCTGWRAKAELAKAFPDNMQVALVGGTYIFTSTVEE